MTGYLLSKKFVDVYQDYFKNVVNTTLDRIEIIEHESIRDRLRRIATYTTMEKTPVQAELMLVAYEMLENKINESPEFQHQAYVIGIALEMVQAYFVILDDVQDEAQTRCNKPCWHLLPDVGLMAGNDASLFRSFINDMLRQNLCDSLYSKVIQIFDKMYFTLEVGQLLDTQFAGKRNYNDYTIENFDAMNKYKSSFYSVKSPILLALALCDRLNKESYKLVDHLGTDLGILVQSHNDFIDYLDVDESIASKSCNDIQNGKFSWPAAAALSICNAEQRKIFEKCYGSPDPDDVNQIRKLYVDLSIHELYRREENARYESFKQKVRKLDKNAVPSPEFFLDIFKLIRNYTENLNRYMHG